MKWFEDTNIKKGRYVLMEKDELERLLPETSKTIEIMDFVKFEEVDPIYFNKSYYLGAQDKNNKAYALLRDALKTTEKIAIARMMFLQTNIGDCSCPSELFDYGDDL